MTENDKVSRRHFLIKAAGALGAAGGVSALSCSSDKSLTPPDEKNENKYPVGNSDAGLPNARRGANKELLPRRILGKTGLEVAMLSFGGGSQFMKNRSGKWEPLLERAIELGVNYFDTSIGYDGSEQRYGELLSPIRDQVFIATKFDARSSGLRNVDEMMRELETSLTRLKTDYVDVFMIHAVDDNDDISQIADGVYKQMLSLKEQGVVKFIGFSSMDSASRSRDLIMTLDFDVCLVAINPTRYGGYAETVLPEAIKKNMGVFAMKVMRNVVGKNGVTARELMHYALDQDGVASAVIGHYGMNILEENAGLVMEFQPSRVPKKRWGALEKRLQPFAGPHNLCWARPDYEDVVRRA